MASNPSTTNKTIIVSVRVPVELHKRFTAAYSDKTKWLLEAIEEKLDRQVQGIKQDAPVNVPVCDSKPLEDNETKTVLPKFKNVASEVIGIISAMRATRTPHGEIADYLNAEGFSMDNERAFTANSGCIKNYDKKYKELNG